MPDVKDVGEKLRTKKKDDRELEYRAEEMFEDDHSYI